MRREIVGSRARGRRHQDAVGDQLRHPLAFVDQDSQARGLMALAEQRDFVDGVMKVHLAMNIGGAHQQRMDRGFPRRRQSRVQIMRRELVHQKADGAAMHPIDRLARAHMLMQRLQHQPVAAKRHHDVGAFGIVIAVELGELGERLLGLGAGARDEGDPVISLGSGHGIAGSSGALKGAGCAEGRLYDLGRACRDSQLRRSRRIGRRARAHACLPRF